MSSDILIVGNGFDLAHQRKTKYWDFLCWLVDVYQSGKRTGLECIDKELSKNTNSSLLNFLIYEYQTSKGIVSWIDLERETQKYINEMNSFIDDYNSNVNEEVLEKISLIRSRNKPFPIKTLVENSKSIFTEHEYDWYKVDQRYLNVWKQIDRDEVYKTIEQELDGISRLLELYLIYIEPTLRDELKQLQDIIDINPAYVISFNYTDTLETLYSIDSSNICYIHGKINNNNIVLGYDDSDKESYDIKFKKYYRRLKKVTDVIDFKRLSATDERGGRIIPKLVFFGHSLDVSDSDVLKDLFKRNNNAVIYCKDADDKNAKIENLILIIGKDEVIQRMNSRRIVFFVLNEDSNLS